MSGQARGAAGDRGATAGMGRLRGLLLAGALLLGCGGPEEPEMSYAYWVERTATVMCTHARQCGGDTTPYDACLADIIEAYTAVEPELDRAEVGAKQGGVQVHAHPGRGADGVPGERVSAGAGRGASARGVRRGRRGVRGRA